MNLRLSTSVILALAMLMAAEPTDARRRRHGPRVAPRIVNGLLTSDYPTTGALLSPGDPNTASLLCSGTLIGCQTFLTAGHCVADDPTPAHYVVFLQHAGFFAVSKIVLEPSFSFPVGDVAVLTLATPVTGIAPTAINTTKTPPPGIQGTIVGFGRSGGFNFDYGLKRVGAVAMAPCTFGISNTTSVCFNFADPVGPPGTDADTCNGDSGGPLLLDWGCGPVVAGTTSGGTSDSCEPIDASYDGNVYFYRSFIEAQGGADLDNTSCGNMPQVGDPGTAVTALSGVLSSGTPQATHTISVPAGTAVLRIAMNATEDSASNFDLYVQQGAVPPTTTSFTCKADGSNQYGFCEFASPTPGAWSILVDRKVGAGIYQVTATTFPSGAPGPGTDGQSCDDGNLCTQADACQHGNCIGAAAPDGTPCDDGHTCTNPDTCQAGACTGLAAYVSGCEQPFVPGKASLILKNTGTPGLQWLWPQGSATTLSQFGNPTVSASYELCVFDEIGGVPSLVMDTFLPPGSAWTPYPKGYRYKDSTGANGGIISLQLRAGTDRSARIMLRGRGDNLPMPQLPLHQDGHVRVQLASPNACWEARYGTSIRNQIDQFRAKAD